MKKFLVMLSAICLLFNNTAVSNAQIINHSIVTDRNTTDNKENTEDKTKNNENLWPQNSPNVHSEAAIVMEASTGAILYSKNIHQTYYPASITKVLTALLAIENSSLGETLTFSKKAIFDVDLDSSRIGIDVGEQLTMEQSLYGIMLESANEVSYGIAEHVAGDVESFSKLMNEKAKELGCTDSNFVNPHGLPDPNHYTSAYDMALISRAAINNDTFRKITGTRIYTIPPTNIQEETRYLANHHKFVKGNIKFDGIIGGKTGYTSKALYTLVTFAERDGMTLISVIMHCDSIPNEYSDTASILNYAFDNFSIYNISDIVGNKSEDTSSLFTKYCPLFNRNTSKLQICPKGNIVLPNDANYNDAKKEIELTPINEIKDGENVIGSIKYTYGGTYVGSADIIYDNVTSPTLLKGAYIPAPTKTPEVDNLNSANLFSSDSKSLKPIIIGIMIGTVVIGTIIYIILIEIPLRKKRNAYRQKRDRRKRTSDKIKIDF
jgi:serine-type D-Ala-D-Ala carboxypeptidase (penicillin-binding protein 5/6)